jgi:hypothetical protein
MRRLNSTYPPLSIAAGFGGKRMFASLRIAVASALIAVAILPAHAADSKLDPDPKILPKARTLATAKVDQNFDLPNDKIPFSIRFGICVVQLTAIRDEGRALPAPRADLDKAIADYRALAIELKAYSAKIGAAEAQKAVDDELAKAAPDTLKFVREDTTALGVTIRTARNTDRLLACQLTKDWYAAQNGLAAPVAAAEQAKVAVLNEQQRAAEKAAAPKPPELPYPPAISPSVVKPKAVTAAPAAPAAATIPWHRPSFPRLARRPAATTPATRGSVPILPTPGHARNFPAGRSGRRWSNASTAWS